MVAASFALYLGRVVWCLSVPVRSRYAGRSCYRAETTMTTLRYMSLRIVVNSYGIGGFRGSLPVYNRRISMALGCVIRHVRSTK